MRKGGFQIPARTRNLIKREQKPRSRRLDGAQTSSRGGGSAGGASPFYSFTLLRRSAIVAAHAAETSETIPARRRRYLYARASLKTLNAPGLTARTVVGNRRLDEAASRSNISLEGRGGKREKISLALNLRAQINFDELAVVAHRISMSIQPNAACICCSFVKIVCYSRLFLSLSHT